MIGALHKPICARLGCPYPVLLAGPGSAEDVCGVARVADATRRGAFGLLDGIGRSAETLRAGIAALRARGVSRFGVDLAGLAVPVPTPEIEALVAAVLALGVPVLALPAGLLPRLMSWRRAEGVVVLARATSLAEAKLAAAAGAGGIILAPGRRKDGRPRSDEAFLDLIAEIADRTECAVLAAGIADGGALATALAFGAEGAVLDSNAAERLGAIIADATSRLATPPASMPASAHEEAIETASPACLAHEMADSYMGFVPADALVARLNALLEAERAGARLALGLAVEAGMSRPLMIARHRDAVRWCGVLAAAIGRLGAVASPHTGPLHAKAMACPDAAARRASLDRGQERVAAALRALLPTLRDDALHAELSAMLAACEHGISGIAANRPSGAVH